MGYQGGYKMTPRSSDKCR